MAWKLAILNNGKHYCVPCIKTEDYAKHLLSYWCSVYKNRGMQEVRHTIEDKKEIYKYQSNTNTVIITLYDLGN